MRSARGINKQSSEHMRSNRTEEEIRQTAAANREKRRLEDEARSAAMLAAGTPGYLREDQLPAYMARMGPRMEREADRVLSAQRVDARPRPHSPPDDSPEDYQNTGRKRKRPGAVVGDAAAESGGGEMQVDSHDSSGRRAGTGSPSRGSPAPMSPPSSPAPSSPDEPPSSPPPPSPSSSPATKAACEVGPETHAGRHGTGPQQPHTNTGARGATGLANVLQIETQDGTRHMVEIGEEAGEEEQLARVPRGPALGLDVLDQVLLSQPRARLPPSRYSSRPQR
jgi:hypothetical protein